LRRLEEGFGKVVCCSTKAATSLKRVKIENKKAVLSQGEPRDAAINFDVYRILH